MASKVKRKGDGGSAGASAAKRPMPNWSAGLKTSMEDPELRVDADDMCVIIKDKYPKVPYHNSHYLYVHPAQLSNADMINWVVL